MSSELRKMSVRDLSLGGKRVFLRVDFNVPLESGAVADDTRIRASLPTIRLGEEKRGRVIVASRLGRPKGRPNPAFSLSIVAQRLQQLLGTPVRFAADCIGSEGEAATRALAPGEVLMLENLRFPPGEEKNDAEFARGLSRLAEAYVNDAFGSAHRAHASVVALCAHLQPAAAGLLMEREIEFLGRLLGNPARPYVAILGGSKVSDKVPLVRNLLPRLDSILIGGAIAYAFLSARGVPIGASRVEKEGIAAGAEILESAAKSGVRIVLPVDHRVGSGIDDPGEGEIVSGEEIPAGRVGLDIGPQTSELYSRE